MQEFTKRQLGRMLGAAATALLIAPPTWGRETGAGPFDIAPFLHPDLKPFLPLLRQMQAAGPFNADNLQARRKSPPPPPLDSPTYIESTIPGPPGGGRVRAYVVNGGQRDSSRPAILSIHGGGMISGSAASELAASQAFAKALDCVVVAVDYRLAPEAPFPAPVEDCYAALAWIHRNAAELGVDSKRVAVMGGSSGGGLAAMLSILARDRGEYPIVFQALSYPMLDDRTGSTRSVPLHQDIVWTAASNRFAWSSFLGVAAGAEKVPAGSVPARERNLVGLPPTFIGVGALDLFFEEDVEYAKRLGVAGIPIELHVYPGCPHAFDAVPATIARQYRNTLLAALKRGLLLPGPPA